MSERLITKITRLHRIPPGYSLPTHELQPRTDFLSTEGAEIAGPSDFIMTRGGAGDQEEEEDEEAEGSDTDDIDHKGEIV